uniref:Potassium voltage-gated channel subfamily E regulatory beta subunit 5 n=1 Tax=Pogona vitticeps TaxID=103695 RepID=A0ABM5EW79_9SAUR
MRLCPAESRLPEAASHVRPGGGQSAGREGESQGSPGHPMNCSDSRRLRRLVARLWRELRGGGSGGAPANASHAAPAAEDDAYLYILLIMIFYGCLAGGLILAYTRSRKLESKHDPYHLYIERDWAAGGRGNTPPGAAAAAAAATEFRDSSFEERERRGSGDSQPL